jgi:sigma-B regulation protein RsbU (phosphoserine phosphatase)
MIKNRSLAVKLSIYILVPVSIIFIAAFWYTFNVSHDIIEENARTNATSLTEATINRIDQVFMSVEKVAQNLATSVEYLNYNDQELNQYLKNYVSANSDVFGCCVAFEPYQFSKKREYSAFYAYKENGKYRSSNIGNDSYQYFYMDWYQIPKELNKATWSEPYFDEGGGNVLMATYSVPFYKTVKGKKVFHGIATVDVSLAWLDAIFKNLKLYDHGYAFLVSRFGTYVVHPNSHYIMNETIFSIAEAKNAPEVRQIGRDIISCTAGFFPFKSYVMHLDGYFYYAPLKSNKWTVAVFFPSDELFAAHNKLKQHIIYIFILGMLAVLIIIIAISQKMIKPLSLLTNATAVIGDGNFDIQLPVDNCQDEIGRLTHSFDKMRKELINYVEHLKETTSAKEKIESELRIAHDIQQSIIPNLFPAFPEKPEFDIFATLKPAKAVGGDLYDFFFIDDDHLCVAIGDVSGKGVPASLFMAITRTLLRSRALGELDPGKIVSNMNNDLCENNDSAMFVTFFLGILNINTGDMQYCNAGHNPSYLLSRQSENVKALTPLHGIPLGVMEDGQYGSDQVKLATNDILVCYTDGVTEAANIEQELFSEQRLEDLLQSCYQLKPKETVDKILEKVLQFEGDAEQADDITILCLNYHK